MKSRFSDLAAACLLEKVTTFERLQLKDWDLRKRDGNLSEALNIVAFCRNFLRENLTQFLTSSPIWDHWNWVGGSLMKWNLMDLMQKAYFQEEGRSKIYTDSQVSIFCQHVSMQPREIPWRYFSWENTKAWLNGVKMRNVSRRVFDNKQCNSRLLFIGWI